MFVCQEELDIKDEPVDVEESGEPDPIDPGTCFYKHKKINLFGELESYDRKTKKNGKSFVDNFL